jgi:predicted HicB family RNase H-like nuclease
MSRKPKPPEPEAPEKEKPVEKPVGLFFGPDDHQRLRVAAAKRGESMKAFSQRVVMEAVEQVEQEK